MAHHRAPLREAFSIPGPAGMLEALLEAPPDAEIRAAGVVCHPHPQHQGSMQNKVVHMLARAAQDQGVASLRLNFRGVGSSGGTHDNGVGESDDAAAVADWCWRELGAEKLWALGFSFGSYVALRLAAARGARLLVTIAQPVQRFDFAKLEIPRCPWLVVEGDADELVGHEAVLGWARDLNPAPQVEILPGAEHFFHGRLTVLRALVGKWLGRNLKAAR